MGVGEIGATAAFDLRVEIPTFPHSFTGVYYPYFAPFPHSIISPSGYFMVIAGGFGVPETIGGSSIIAQWALNILLLTSHVSNKRQLTVVSIPLTSKSRGNFARPVSFLRIYLPSLRAAPESARFPDLVYIGDKATFARPIFVA